MGHPDRMQPKNLLELQPPAESGMVNSSSAAHFRPWEHPAGNPRSPPRLVSLPKTILLVVTRREQRTI